MKAKLPPVKTFRAFESAAKYESFLKAADELCITAAAISHQIRTLEEFLGTKLFIRKTRQVVLTEEGQVLSAVIGKSLDQIREAAHSISANKLTFPLKASLPPHFFVEWALPHVIEFREKHPQITLDIVNTQEFMNNPNEECDISVCWNARPKKGWRREELFSLEYVPMCSPNLFSDSSQIPELDEFSDFDLIMVNNSANWQKWYQKANFPEPENAKTFVVDNFMYATHIAIAGQGIALCPKIFAQRHIQNRELMILSDIQVVSESKFDILCSEENLSREQTKLFWDWILRKAKRERA